MMLNNKLTPNLLRRNLLKTISVSSFFPLALTEVCFGQLEYTKMLNGFKKQIEASQSMGEIYVLYYAEPQHGNRDGKRKIYTAGKGATFKLDSFTSDKLHEFCQQHKILDKPDWGSSIIPLCERQSVA